MKIQLSGLPVLLFLIFLILKLTHVISWSWLLICLPLYPAIVCYVIVVAIGLYLIWSK
jgi:hypothetical protein